LIAAAAQGRGFLGFWEPQIFFGLQYQQPRSLGKTNLGSIKSIKQQTILCLAVQFIHAEKMNTG